jgi:hypothetical protein
VPSLRVKWLPPLIPLLSRVAVIMPFRPSLQRTGIEMVGEVSRALSSPPHVSDPLDTLKEPPLTDAVVVPLMTPPGMPLPTTATGSVIAQPASTSARSEQNQSAHSHPPAAFVIVVRRVGALRQLVRQSCGLFVRTGPLRVRDRNQLGKTAKTSAKKTIRFKCLTGAPEEIRTPDPQIRSLVLYPAELRALRSPRAAKASPERGRALAAFGEAIKTEPP